MLNRANAGGFPRALAKSTSSVRLYATPKPPRTTVVSWNRDGLQARPMRGPKLFLSGWVRREARATFESTRPVGPNANLDGRTAVSRSRREQALVRPGVEVR